MKSYKEFYQSVASQPTSAGKPPGVGTYLLVRIADNLSFILLVAILVVLIASFAWYGLHQGDSQSEKVKWALNAASLCLGVFLGLFAGKTIR